MKFPKFFICLLLILLTSSSHAYNKYQDNQQVGVRSAHVYESGNARIQEIEFTDDILNPESSYVKRHLGLQSWYPAQFAKKFLNRVKIGESTQIDILKLLSGPNIITLEYPSEREMWVYHWLWSYDLRYPIEDTLVKMDHPGRRMLRGKNPVELEIVFNDKDIVSDIRMRLIKRGPEK